ncbi:hypothetical protein [Paraliomyxa miuraensis]|uniref:hypothetical protein n=1 Tax=Paraliomyxa miuraensis TaxID=376150 RepID=UPI0022516832|nr:hypothetical protein [Paraliomyxa miuraensis]MCX4240928.1 hypothetical protein [Paraliomyxa miuraensis]
MPTAPKTLWIAALLVLPVACDQEPEGRPALQGLQPSSQDDGLVLADRTFLVDAEPDTEMYVADEELVFYGGVVKLDDDWQPGDLLVNGAGVGFLRRVVDVEEAGTEVVVQTEMAELHDIVAQGGFHGQFKPFSEGLRLSDDSGAFGDFVARVDAQGNAVPLDQFTAGVDAQGASGSAGHIEFDPTTLVSAGGLRLDLTGGHFSFDPDLDLDVDLGWWSIDRFEVLAKGTMDAEIELRLGTDGNYEILDRSVKLWESPRYAWYGFIGPVPVVVVTTMELGATVSVATHGPSSVTMGAGANSWVQVGAIYDGDDGWDMVGDHGFNFRYSGPEFVLDTELDARVALDGVLKVELYDVVGPQLTMSPWAAVNANAMGHWSADIGVKGKIGGAVSLPWHDDIGIDAELFDWSHRLAEGELY